MFQGGENAFPRFRRAFAGFATALLVTVICLLHFAVPASANLEETARWGGPALPADEATEWDGEFKAIGDLAIGPAGVVGAYDPVLGRAQLFTPDGGLIRIVDGPTGVNGSGDTVGLDLRDDGTIEVFDRAAERLHRFDSEGDLIDQINFDFTGNVQDFSLDPSGGYIATFGEQLRVARFESAGGEIVNWATARVLEGEHRATVEIAEDDVDDRVYLASEYLLGMFSRSGEPWANWSLATEECDVTGPGLIDLALDSEGSVYLLAAVSSSGDRTTLFKIDDTMNEVWREAVDPGFNKLAVGPDDAIYLAGSGLEVVRFTRTEPEIPVGLGNCEKPPPVEPKEFELLGLKYGPDRAWARIRMYAPEAGQITVSGPKVRWKTRTLSSAGNHAITVKAKPVYLKPARPRRQLKLAVQVTYRTSSGAIRQDVTVQLRGKLRKRS